MDIICARCGKHFSSIEAAREHRGNCRETSSNEPIRWLPAKKSKISPEEWDNLMKLINPHDIHRAPLNEDSRARESERTKDVPEYDIEEPPEPVVIPNVKPEKIDQPTGFKNKESDGKTQYFKRADSADSGNTGSLKAKNADKKLVQKTYGHNIQVQNWLIALMLTFALSIVGLGISMFVGSFIPLWLILGFSIIYSIEKWFSYFTRKYKGIGKLYRFLLNLSVLSLLGLLVWTGIELFSQQFVQNSLVGSLVFLAEFIFFIWMWKVVAKNSWRWPSMKLTIFSLLCLCVIFAFAGVQPMADYKDNILSKMSGSGSTPTMAPSIPVTTPHATSPPPSAISSSPSATPTPSSTVSPTVLDKIDPKTGQYKNYYLGLVKNPEVEGGSGCYDIGDDFIILINNKNAKNPTYSELVNFLQSDKTDEFSYQLSFLTNQFYYGQAEDNVDLGHIKEIIDGTTQPSAPRVCADFAERLHNEAETAGIKCGYVVVDNLSHALNVFETTDRGLVYIDDTGKPNDLQSFTIALPNSITFGEPISWDKVAYIENGKTYGIISLECALYFGLDYSGYEKWLDTKKDLDNLDTEYDRLAGGRILVPEDTYNQLQNILTQEKALASKLGGFWDSLGTVTSYYITWDGNWRNRK